MDEQQLKNLKDPITLENQEDQVEHLLVTREEHYGLDLGRSSNEEGLEAHPSDAGVTDLGGIRNRKDVFDQQPNLDEGPAAIDEAGLPGHWGIDEDTE